MESVGVVSIGQFRKHPGLFIETMAEEYPDFAMFIVQDKTKNEDVFALLPLNFSVLEKFDELKEQNPDMFVTDNSNLRVAGIRKHLSAGKKALHLQPPRK